MDHPDWGGVAVVAGMYAAFLAVGWLAVRRVKDGAAGDLIVAGRAMPLWMATLTMTATWVDGGYLLGTAEYTYRHGTAYGLQGGVCFGLSLIVGGLVFAKTMRRMEYSTMLDPFEVRFGERWAAVLFLPAFLGELFWSGALLVAIGSTFGVLLGVDLTTAILLSAAVVTLYTMAGGLWSVAYTDVFQLGLVVVGLLAVLPFALHSVGGLASSWDSYVAHKQSAAFWIPPRHADGYWTAPGIAAWWDTSLMLMLGGIPWNCYFQRVLSCQTPGKARAHSILAGLCTIALTVPPFLLGVAAFARWGEGGVSPPSATFPMVLQRLVPYPVMLLGLAGIIGAVTSSFSASILSAGSMFSWNVYRRLIAPQAPEARLHSVIRVAIAALGLAAVLLALKVRSVAALWFFTSDLVYVLLFPQLVAALFDPAANRVGSATAFGVSLLLRLGGGMSLETDDGLIGFPAVIPYPEFFARWLPGTPGDWYDPAGATLFPVKTLAAVAGLVLIPLVSRMTARRDPPRTLSRADVQSRPSQ